MFYRFRISIIRSNVSYSPSGLGADSRGCVDSRISPLSSREGAGVRLKERFKRLFFTLILPDRFKSFL